MGKAWSELGAEQRDLVRIYARFGAECIAIALEIAIPDGAPLRARFFEAYAALIRADSGAVKADRVAAWRRVVVAARAYSDLVVLRFEGELRREEEARAAPRNPALAALARAFGSLADWRKEWICRPYCSVAADGTLLERGRPVGAPAVVPYSRCEFLYRGRSIVSKPSVLLFGEKDVPVYYYSGVPG